MGKQFTYVGPHDEVDVLGQVVKHGGRITVEGDAADSLAEQPDNWSPFGHKPKKKPAPAAAETPAGEGSDDA